MAAPIKNDQNNLGLSLSVASMEKCVFISHPLKVIFLWLKKQFITAAHSFIRALGVCPLLVNMCHLQCRSAYLFICLSVDISICISLSLRRHICFCSFWLMCLGVNFNFAKETSQFLSMCTYHGIIYLWMGYSALPLFAHVSVRFSPCFLLVCSLLLVKCFCIEEETIVKNR